MPSRSPTGPSRRAPHAAIHTEKLSSHFPRLRSSTLSWLKHGPTALAPLWSPPPFLSRHPSGPSCSAPRLWPTRTATSASGANLLRLTRMSKANSPSSPWTLLHSPRAVGSTHARLHAEPPHPSGDAAPSAQRTTKPSVLAFTRKSSPSAQPSAQLPHLPDGLPPLFLITQRAFDTLRLGPLDLQWMAYL